MVIVIPTYKRIHFLRWTLISLLKADIPKDFRNVVCLANNDPQQIENLNSLIKQLQLEYDSASKWKWEILNREKTLFPIENWYGAISDTALENEVVFLHGDDDLFTPWGIVDRFNAITSTNSDMLLSDSAHGLLFVNETDIHWNKPLPSRNKQATLQPIQINRISGEFEGWGPTFIGNHCYRYTKLFREALSICFEWCHQQKWLDWNNRTLMLPYYLPFAIKHIGGILFGLHQLCVIRGTSLKEIINAKYGVPGWNSGFLSLCAYGVLTSPPLSEYTEIDSARKEQLNMAAEWFFTFFFDKRIDSTSRQETLHRIKIPINYKLLIKMAFSLKFVLKEFMPYQSRMVFAQNNVKKISALHFLKSISNGEAIKI